LARNALGLITFGGLATAGIGAAYGAHTDLILAGVGAAGLAYGTGQLTTERGYDQVYLAGIAALNCIDSVISPVAGSFALLEARKTSLDTLIGTLDEQIRAARALAKAGGEADGKTARDADKLVASARALAARLPAGKQAAAGGLRMAAGELEAKAGDLRGAGAGLTQAAADLKTAADSANDERIAGDRIRQQAILRIIAEPDLANSAVPALVAIDNQMARQIMQRRPSLEQYFSVLQSVPGFGAGMLPPAGSGSPTPE